MDFDKLYNTYYMSVYSYVMTIVKNAHLAEEITQQTFFKALNGKFDGRWNIPGCAPLRKTPPWTS